MADSASANVATHRNAVRVAAKSYGFCITVETYQPDAVYSIGNGTPPQVACRHMRCILITMLADQFEALKKIISDNHEAVVEPFEVAQPEWYAALIAEFYNRPSLTSRVP